MTNNKILEQDITNLIGYYKISEILDTMLNIANDDQIHEIRMWFNEYFGKNIRGGEPEEDIIEVILHEIDHLKMKVAEIERDGVDVKPTQAVIPKELLDNFNDLVLSISENGQVSWSSKSKPKEKKK